MYQRIYSRHISYLYFNSLYFQLQVSTSKLSGIRKDTLKYKMSKINFDFEISRVDCILKENYYSPFNIKNTYMYQSPESPPPPDFPNFYSKKNFFKYMIYTYTFGICKQNHCQFSELFTLENLLIILPNRRIMRLAWNSQEEKI